MFNLPNYIATFLKQKLVNKMDYVHEQTLKTFIKKEITYGLERIIKENH